MQAGMVGVYTGMKGGAFSISENERFPHNHTAGLVENLIMGFLGYKEISWVIRDTLESCDSFDCAYH